MRNLAKKELVPAAKELNKVIGCKPPIPTGKDATAVEMEPAIEAAIALIDPKEDVFSEETQTVIDNFKATMEDPKEKKEKAPKAEKKEKAAKSPKEEDAPKKEKKGKKEKKAAKSPKKEKAPKEKKEKAPKEKKEKAPKEKKEKAPKEKKEKAPKAEKKGKKGPGVIASIIEFLEAAGDKGITREKVTEKLIKRFPDKNEMSMRNTVKVQLPGRINKEKFEVKKLKKGHYAKA